MLLTATEVETEALMERMAPLSGESHLLRAHIDGQVYTIGTFASFGAVHTECEPGSVGRDGSSLTANDAISWWSPAAVVMPGIAFGLKENKQRIGDVLVSKAVQDYEPQRVGDVLIPRGDKPRAGRTLLGVFKRAKATWRYFDGDGSRVGVHMGVLLSGEKLVDQPKFRRKLKTAFPEAVGGEMEAAGLHAAAERRRVEWIVAKSVCDWGQGKGDDHQSLAARTAVSFCRWALMDPHVLDSLGATPSNATDDPAPLPTYAELSLGMKVASVGRLGLFRNPPSVSGETQGEEAEIKALVEASLDADECLFDDDLPDDGLADPLDTTPSSAQVLLDRLANSQAHIGLLPTPIGVEEAAFLAEQTESSARVLLVSVQDDGGWNERVLIAGGRTLPLAGMESASGLRILASDTPLGDLLIVDSEQGLSELALASASVAVIWRAPSAVSHVGQLYATEAGEAVVDVQMVGPTLLANASTRVSPQEGGKGSEWGLLTKLGASRSQMLLEFTLGRGGRAGDRYRSISDADADGGPALGASANIVEFCERLHQMDRRYLKMPELFVESSEHQRIRDLLARERIVVVLGDPGLGKTYTAMMLLFELSSAGYTPQLYRQMSQTGGGASWDLEMDSILRPRTVTYFEDPWGRTSYQLPESTFNSFASLVRQAKYSDAYVVITSREAIFGRFVAELGAQEGLEEVCDSLRVGLAYDEDALVELLGKYARTYGGQWSSDPALYQFVLEEGVATGRLCTPLAISHFASSLATQAASTREALLASIEMAMGATWEAFSQEISDIVVERREWDRFLVLAAAYLELPCPLTWEAAPAALGGLENRLGHGRPLEFTEAVNAYAGYQLDGSVRSGIAHPGRFRFVHPSYAEAFASALERPACKRAMFELVQVLLALEAADMREALLDSCFALPPTQGWLRDCVVDACLTGELTESALGLGAVLARNWPSLGDDERAAFLGLVKLGGRSAEWALAAASTFWHAIDAVSREAIVRAAMSSSDVEARRSAARLVVANIYDVTDLVPESWSWLLALDARSIRLADAVRSSMNSLPLDYLEALLVLLSESSDPQVLTSTADILVAHWDNLVDLVDLRQPLANLGRCSVSAALETLVESLSVFVDNMDDEAVAALARWAIDEYPDRFCEHLLSAPWILDRLDAAMSDDLTERVAQLLDVPVVVVAGELLPTIDEGIGTKLIDYAHSNRQLWSDYPNEWVAVLENRVGTLLSPMGLIES